MHCTNCATRLEGLEHELTGVHKGEASYRKGLMQVQYDDNLLSTAETIAAVQKMGYQAVVI